MTAESTAGVRERRQVWLMFVAGTLAAGTEAWLAGSKLWTPPRHLWGVRFWVVALLWSAVCVGVSVSGGAMAAWGAGLLVRGRYVGADRVWRAAAVGWALLPCLVVKAVRGSWWVLPVAALAAVATVFRMRPLFHSSGEEKPREDASARVMASLDGLPPMGAPPAQSLVLAGSVQIFLLFAIKGAMVSASLALAFGIVLLIVRWTAWDGRWALRWSGDRTAIRLCGTAVILLMLMVTPWMGGGMGTQAAGAGAKAGGGTPNPGRTPRTNQPGADYVGIVLWPPPKKKVEITPPPPNSVALGHGIGSKRLIIPFDGPYWYFKAPMTEPGPKAHVTFGKSTEAKVQSTNWMPLRMEAHQNLGLPIDLDCCREIDVTVTNADNRAGRIDVALVLSDTDSAGRRSMNLGDQPVVSSERTQVRGLDKAPVTETLKFAVPRAKGVKRFNEINVVIQPPVERARLGSRIAVEEFELVPR